MKLMRTTQTLPAPLRLRADFERDGYIVLPGIFGAAQISEIQQEADRLSGLSSLIRPDNIRTEHYDDEGVARINKFDPVLDLSPLLRDAAMMPSIHLALRAIWGEDGLLLKDKLVFKLPGHHGFGPHRDEVWWEPFPSSAITATISIDAMNAQNGSLEMAPGFHTLPNPVAPGVLRDLQGDEIPPECAWRPIYTHPGDVVLFGATTPHRSGTNRSEQARRLLHLSFTPTKYGDLYAAHYEHHRNYMLAVQPESKGNAYVKADYRHTADFIPPIPGVATREGCKGARK